MSPEDTVQRTMWLMVFLQTIGSVDMPGSGERKLPSPRSYVAIVVTWSILGMIAGGRWGKAAASASILLVLTGAVIGPFGARAASFLTTVAHTFQLGPQTTTTTTGTAAPTTETV
jgi:hypothetical protein